MTHHPHFIELIPTHLEETFFNFQSSEVNSLIKEMLDKTITIKLNENYTTKLKGFSNTFTQNNSTTSLKRSEWMKFWVTLFVEKATRSTSSGIEFGSQFHRYYHDERNIDLLSFFIAGALSNNPIHIYIFDGKIIRINVESGYRKAKMIEPELFGSTRLNFNNIVHLTFKGKMAEQITDNEFTLDESERTIIQQLRGPKYKIDKLTIHMKGNNQVKNLEIEGKEFDMDQKPFLDEQILYGAVYPYKHKGINQHLRIQERIDIESSKN